MSLPMIVKLEKLCKDYGKENVVVHALQSVDLEIEKGTLTAIAGPSGSGKTTLLNMISGLDRPSSGRVWVEDQEVTSMNRSALSRMRLKRIGFVFQAHNLIPVLTALENVEYVLMLQGLPSSRRRQRVMEMLNQVGLAGLENRFPRELSGGQQQRVAIARAIISEPALVLADEPTANVDSKTAASLLDLMVRLNQERGVTFLFSTHDQNVMKRAKRLILFRDGMVERDESPEVFEKKN